MRWWEGCGRVEYHTRCGALSFQRHVGRVAPEVRASTAHPQRRAPMLVACKRRLISKRSHRGR